MSDRDDVLADIAEARQDVADAGLRRYALVLRTRTWSGAARGLPLGSTPTDSDVTITPPPKVRLVSEREIASSGGLLKQGDYQISRVTPAYTSPSDGGYAPSDIDPMLQSAPASNVERTWILTGDEGSFECTIVGSWHLEEPFNYRCVMRRVRALVPRG